MKVLIIKASAPGEFKTYKQYQGSPPQSIYSLAAATPKDVEYQVIDETANQTIPQHSNVNLVVVFASTPDAVHAYHVAESFRRQGISVVLAGLHASFLPDEAAQHADSIMIGEAEGIWETLLDDFRQGELKSRYTNRHAVDLAQLKPFPHDRIDLSRYAELSTVLVSRGCKFQCNYCTVPGFFPQLRMRPVSAVVDEIRHAGLKWVELHADNLIADRNYALELFHALAPLNIYWGGEATLNIAQDEELLAAAAASGCAYLVVGLETPSQSALDGAGKGFILIDRVKENIERLHAYGIAVDSALLFGFDEHDTTIFRRTLEWVDDIQLDVAHTTILTPFPGTPLFQQLQDENRILTTDWRQYDCSHVVFQPKQMSPAQLQEGCNWFYWKHNSSERRMKRYLNRPPALKWLALTEVAQS